MKLKDLTNSWHKGDNYAILNLPFICYSVQPHWRNKFENESKLEVFTASFKSSITAESRMEEEYNSLEEAKLACEKHLTSLINYVFYRLDNIVDFKYPIKVGSSIFGS